VYVPAAMTGLAERSGASAVNTAKLASLATALLGIGTIIGALLTPLLIRRLDRRSTLAVFFTFMLVFLPLSFGYVFYMGAGALEWFLVCTFFLGLGGANFVVYSFWIPEQYSTECRVSAFAFTTNIGRFAGAGLTFLVGAGVRHFGTLGMPVALTALAFVLGLAALPFGVETKGQELPS
jgi:MFS family permease